MVTRIRLILSGFFHSSTEYRVRYTIMATPQISTSHSDTIEHAANGFTASSDDLPPVPAIPIPDGSVAFHPSGVRPEYLELPSLWPRARCCWLMSWLMSCCCKVLLDHWSLVGEKHGHSGAAEGRKQTSSSTHQLTLSPSVFTRT